MQEFLNNIIPNVMAKLPDFYAAIGDTLLMVVWSGAISFVLGLTLGVLITVTKPGGILENKIVYQILDKLVSLFRSIPFIILLTWVMPVSRAIMGTAIYVRGAIVPLVFGAVPFFTRQVESALAELDGGLVEAALSMGSTPLEIIFRVYPVSYTHLDVYKRQVEWMRMARTISRSPRLSVPPPCAFSCRIEPSTVR